MKNKISHVNPNCIDARYCESHGETGEVYYSSKNVLKMIKDKLKKK